jgi:hypothetical protein
MLHDSELAEHSQAQYRVSRAWSKARNTPFTA